jgi:hypothetical protein
MAATKQCSKCGEGYDYDLKACPGCGYQGYKLVQVGDEPVAPSPPAHSPAPPPPAPTADFPVTPVDSQLQAQRVLGWIAAGLMLASLFMVWVQASVAAGTYLKICEMVANNLEDALNLAGNRVLGVFVPGLAALGVLSGAISISQTKSAKSGFVSLLTCGLLATLSAWQLRDYVDRSGAGFVDLTGALGPGFELYTVTAIGAVAIGLWGTLSAPAAATRAGATSFAAFDGFVAFAQQYRTAFVACGICVALAGTGVELYPLFKQQQQKAQFSACQSNMKQIGMAMMQYTQDYDERMPVNDNWCDAIMPYTKNSQIFVCPSLPNSKCGYAMNRNLRGAALRDLSFGPAMVFEASGGWNSVGLPSQSAAFRHLKNKTAWYVRTEGSCTTFSSTSDLLSLDGPDLSLCSAVGPDAPTFDPPSPPVQESYADSANTSTTPALDTCDTGDGFTISRPEGWDSERTSDGKSTVVQFTSPDGTAKFKVQWLPQPETNPLDAYPLRTEKNWQKKSSTRYQRLTMEPVTVAGNDGLRWEFLRQIDGKLMHTVDLFANCNGRGYAIWARTPQSEWSRWEPTLEQILSSFSTY